MKLKFKDNGGGVHTLNEDKYVAIGSQTNLNDCTEDGVKYYITGPYYPINCPLSGAHNSVVWAYSYANGAYIVQFYACYNVQCVWYRFCEVGVWRDWIEIGPSTARKRKIELTLPAINPQTSYTHVIYDFGATTPYVIQIQEAGGAKPLLVTNWWVDAQLNLVMQIMNLHPTDGYPGGGVIFNIIT